MLNRGMLEQEPSLRGRLLFYVVLGLIVFLVAPLWISESLCPPKEKGGWTIKGNRYPADDKRSPHQFESYLTIEQNQTSNDHEQTSKNNFGDHLPSWLCNETKITDLLLAVFTYYLVIVGWFGIRSAERATRQLERPYVFGTPQIDRVQTAPGGKGNVFVEIILENYGKTVATVETIYGQASLFEPTGKPTYESGSVRTAMGAIGPHIKFRAPVSFECPVTSDFYFSGYIIYSDTFRKTHTSRYCAKLFLGGGGIEAAGTEAWSDWN